MTWYCAKGRRAWTAARTRQRLEPLAAFYPQAMQPIAAAMLHEERAAMTDFVRRGVEASLADECACPPADEANS